MSNSQGQDGAQSGQAGQGPQAGGGGQAGQSSVVPSAVSAAPVPEGSKDPLRLMIEIAKDPVLTPEDKTSLIVYSRERFLNRRRMAYASLYTIIGSIIFLFLAALLDGFSSSQILDKIKENQGLFGSILGFLTAIVGAYYGVSAWRPSS